MKMPLAGLKLDLDLIMSPGGGRRTVKDIIRYLQEKLKRVTYLIEIYKFCDQVRSCDQLIFPFEIINLV